MFLFRRLPFPAFSVAFLYPTSQPPSPLLRHNGLMLLPSALPSLRLNRKRRKGGKEIYSPGRRGEKRGGERHLSKEEKHRL